LQKTANFQIGDPAQARANRRGLEHSPKRRFAVPLQRVRQVRALLYYLAIGFAKNNQVRKYENKNDREVALLKNLFVDVWRDAGAPLGKRAM
jgi:hypothetical protein